MRWKHYVGVAVAHRSGMNVGEVPRRSHKVPLLAPCWESLLSPHTFFLLRSHPNAVCRVPVGPQGESRVSAGSHLDPSTKSILVQESTPSILVLRIFGLQPLNCRTQRQRLLLWGNGPSLKSCAVDRPFRVELSLVEKRECGVLLRMNLPSLETRAARV